MSSEDILSSKHNIEPQTCKRLLKKSSDKNPLSDPGGESSSVWRWENAKAFDNRMELRSKIDYQRSASPEKVHHSNTSEGMFCLL